MPVELRIGPHFYRNHRIMILIAEIIDEAGDDFLARNVFLYDNVGRKDSRMIDGLDQLIEIASDGYADRSVHMARLDHDRHGKGLEQIMGNRLDGIGMIHMQILGIRSLYARALQGVARQLLVAGHDGSCRPRACKRHMESLEDMLHSPIATIISMQGIVYNIDMAKRFFSKHGKAVDMPDSFFIDDDIYRLVFAAIRLLAQHIDDARAHIHRQIIAIRIAASQNSDFDMRHVCST